MFDYAVRSDTDNRSVERPVLQEMVDAGLSLTAMGTRSGRHPSSVSYWLAQYGLAAPARDKHLARGGISRETLAAQVAAGRSIAQIAAALGVSKATVRHWLARHGLRTAAAERLAMMRQARAAGQQNVRMVCSRHGETDFLLEGRGYYRCLRCRWERVVRRRREVKATLVAEAGGRCLICGYERYAGALHFHHREPGEKNFGLAEAGATRSLERARAEARKCVLLCSNCHAEIEGGVIGLPR